MKALAIIGVIGHGVLYHLVLHLVHEERIMTRTKAYQKRQAKATQHRRRKAHERLQRDQAQAQRAAEALAQALQAFALLDTLVQEIGRSRP